MRLQAVHEDGISQVGSVDIVIAEASVYTDVKTRDLRTSKSSDVESRFATEASIELVPRVELAGAIDVEQVDEPLPDAGKRLTTTEIVTANPSGVVRQTVVFVDAAIEDYQTLLDGLEQKRRTVDIESEFHVFVLDAERDGIDHISEVLSTYQEVSALHILSHGANGSLQLGNTHLSGDNLDTYSSQIEQWQNSLSDDADILLYGCEIAAGNWGVEFVDNLAEFSGADVAASVDLTGSVALGGDWTLEFQTGQIDATTLSIDSRFDDVLGTVSFDTGKLSYVDGIACFLPLDLICDLASLVFQDSELEIRKLNDQLIIEDKGSGNRVSAGSGVTDLDALNSSVTIDVSSLNGMTEFEIDTGAGQDSVTFTSDLFLNGADLEVNAEEITVDQGVTISTYVGKSAAGAGDITFNAQQQINPFITLIPFADVTSTDSAINIDGATIKGAAISMTALADSANLFSDDSTGSSIPESALDFIGSMSLLGGFAQSTATADINVLGDSQIEADTLRLNAEAKTQAKVKTATVYLGVAVGISEPSATITVADGVSIHTTGDVALHSNAESSLNVSASQGLMGPSRTGETVNITFAYGKSDITSNVQIAQGALVDSGGSLSLIADMEQSTNVNATAGAYDDGSVGTAVSISNVTSNVDAIVNGTALATGDMLIQADSRTSRNDTAAAAGVGTGYGAKKVFAIKDKTGFGKLQNFFNKKLPFPDSRSTAPKKIAFSAAFAYAAHTNNTNAHIGDNATVISRDGSVAVEATIIDMPEISSVATIDSDAIDDAGRAAANAGQLTFFGNSVGNSKDNSFSAAVALGNYTNTTLAYIGKNAVVDAAGDIVVDAETRLPYEIQWTQINSPDDILDKLNSNLGLQNGFFTSWSQSNAGGNKTAIAGTVNVLTFDNTAKAYIDENAEVNAQRLFVPSTPIVGDAINFGDDHHFMDGQAVVYGNGGAADSDGLGLQNGTTYYVIWVSDTTIKLADSRANALAEHALTDLSTEGAPGIQHSLSASTDGTVRVEANNEIFAVHLSGVFGLKFFGTKNGKTGVGGAYLEVGYENTTEARIKSGAEVNAQGLVVRADTTTHNISIAESGGKASSFAANGSFSLLTTDNTTVANVDDGAKITTATKQVVLSKDVRDLYSPTNELLFSSSNIVSQGTVNKVAITKSGSGYTSAPTVTFSAPTNGGVAAQGTSVIDGAGTVTGVSITTKGSGYTSAPTVTFSAPTSGGEIAEGTVYVDSEIEFLSDHNLLDDTKATYLSLGGSSSQLAGLQDGTEYYVDVLDASRVQLSTTENGSPIVINPPAGSSTFHELRFSEGNALLFKSQGDLSEKRENIPQSLDSNNDGKVDASDVNIVKVENGFYYTNLNQFISAEDDSQIYNVGGGFVKGESVGIGASVAINEITRDTQAIVGNQQALISENDLHPGVGIDSEGVVDLGYQHGFSDGESVVYSNGGAGSITGLVDGDTYYVDRVDAKKLRLSRTAQENTQFFDASSVNGTAGLEIINLRYDHGFRTGDAVLYNDGGGTPIDGLVDGETYYVIAIDAQHLALTTLPDRAVAETRNRFDPADTVDDNRLKFPVDHEFKDGQRVQYHNGGGTSIGGLTGESFYYVIVEDTTTIQLSETLHGAPINNLDSSSAQGKSHSLQPVIDPSSAVDSDQAAINLGYEHGFAAGDSVVYEPNGGSSIGGLSDAGIYYVIPIGATVIALTNSEAEAEKGTFRIFNPAQAISSEGVINLGINHGFEPGDEVIYSAGDGSGLVGLTDGQKYYVSVVDEQTLKLKTTPSGEAITQIDFSAAIGTHHSLRGDVRIALDGTVATSDTHTFRPNVRIDIATDSAVGNLHRLRLFYTPEESSGATHGFGRAIDPSTAVGNANTIDLGYTHGLSIGQKVLYTNGGGKSISGLLNNHYYFVVVVDAKKIQLAARKYDAETGKAIDLDGAVATGNHHGIGAAINAAPSVDGASNVIDMGRLHGLANGQALTYRNGGGDSIGGLDNGESYYVIKVDDKKIRLAETKAKATKENPDAIDLAPSVATGFSHTLSDPTDGDGFIESGGAVKVNAVAPEGTIFSITVAASVVTEPDPVSAAEAPQNAGKYGIGISGAASKNTIANSTEAIVRDVDLRNATNMDVSARTDNDIFALAGTVAIVKQDSVAGGGSGAGIGGAVTLNDLSDTNNKTRAVIENSTVDISGDLSILTSTSGEIQSVAASGAGAMTKNAGGAIAGSVALNSINHDTTAYLSNSQTVSDSVKIYSENDSTIDSDAGGVAVAKSGGSSLAIGASIAINDISDNKTLAYVDNSKVTAGQLIEIEASAAQEIEALAIAGALSASQGKLNGAVAVSVTANEIGNFEVDASIRNGSVVTTTTDGNVELVASDTSKIISDAGGVAVAASYSTEPGSSSFTGSVGASVSDNTIRGSVKS